MSRTILALTRYDRLGASSRVRILQYLPMLEARGFRIEVQPLFSDSDLQQLYRDSRRSSYRLLRSLAARTSAIARARAADVIWLQQEVFPFLPFAVESLLLAGKKVVMDFDDAQHLYYKSPTLRRLFWGAKIERLMRRVDAVVAGSPAMERYARNAGARRVELVHSAVATRGFPWPPPAPRKFTVGWIGTPMTAEQSLHLVREPLTRFLAESGADTLFIGMEKSQFPELGGERLAWSEAVERAALPRLSVGLCPLDDTPWSRGKSGYKIIQYMAAGKPTLASPVGIAAELVRDGSTGFHCRTPEEWYARLRQLRGDESLALTQGANARRLAESHYDIMVAAERLGALFEDLARE